MRTRKPPYRLTCEPCCWWDKTDRSWTPTPSLNCDGVRRFKTLRQARSGAMGAINSGAMRTLITRQDKRHFREWIWEVQGS